MLHTLVGPENFKKGLQHYLKENDGKVIKTILNSLLCFPSDSLYSRQQQWKTLLIPSNTLAESRWLSSIVGT